jgi:hypothetical protein
MIREVCRCPYCSVPVAIDCQARNVVFDPDGTSGAPCPHLVCYWICLSFAGRGGKKLTKSTIWEVGRGAHDVNILESLDDAGLTHFLMDYGFGTLPEELRPQGDHRIVGDSAALREEAKPGTGEFDVKLNGRSRRAILDGWAIYAPEPSAVLKELEEVAYQYEI